jgi:hypothetical protein
MNRHDMDPTAQGLASARSTQRLARLGLFGLAALVSACGGGGDSSSSGGVTGGSFQLLTISGMPPGVTNEWKLNRPIELVFSSPVDFASVNSSSIRIRTNSGQQALGEFSLKQLQSGGVDATTVVFQPRCPTLTDLSDAGFELGEQYTLTIIGKDGGSGISLHAASGQPLATSQLRTFETPSGSIASELFFDPIAGPPSVIVADPGVPGSVGSFVRVGGEGGTVIPFELSLGLPVEIPDLPINLYSGGDQRLEVFLEFDQPVNPSAANIDADRLHLQFFDPGTSQWIDLPTAPVLIKNCTTTGAQVRLDPVGILPPDVLLRVEVAAAFEDLVGDQNSLPTNDFSRFRTALDLDPSFNPQAIADEVLESFDDVTRFDATVLPEIPIADWGNGRLSAAFAFPTSTSVPADFDIFLAANEIEVVNTVADVIAGGPGTSEVFNQVVTGGIIFCRNLTLSNNAVLRFEGDNPARIFATGTVSIQGRIEGVGFDAINQNSLQSAASILGASGNLGGGDGGIASPSNILSQPDILGGTGFGPGDLPDFGGRGGEAGFGTLNDDNRRTGGGGGGVTNNALQGTQVHLIPAPNVAPSAGNDGTPIVNDNPASGAKGALSGVSPPRGGAVGLSLFQDAAVNNNFFGLRRVGVNLVVGELSAPTAGSGGGAGGDSIRQVNFPGNFVQANNMRGASGAGGGGIVQISSLGTFSITGANGRITVAGGLGARGERTISDNRGVAGGSGGGSGGMIIVESATSFSFAGATLPCLQAEGGLGGPGKNGNGNSYGSAVSGEAGGGNGGYGIIQIHVPDDTTIAGFERITLPVGITSTNNLGRPNPFVLVPTFGALSQATSRAIPIGGANQNPSSVLPQVQYRFSPLPVPTGFIPATAGVVTNEAAILIEPLLSVNDTTNVVTVDASTLFANPTSNVYLRNTELMRNFRLRLVQAPADLVFTVATASFDINTNVLTLQLEGNPDLSPFSAGGTTARLAPRFYRVRTAGVADSLPAESTIRVEFQGLAQDISGNPGAEVVPWTTDINALSTAVQTVDFVKFRVTFNIDASSNGLLGTETLPTLEFLRFLLEF